MPDNSSHDIKHSSPCLYLFPVPLSSGDVGRVLPELNIQIIRDIKYFVVENVRSARRFLKKCDSGIDIDSLTFFELNRHTAVADIAGFLAPMAAGNSMGVISEAGCPAIADPGADVVAIAQSRGYRVVPLVGPSSILMSLMASGFNGQSFAFLGYLPVDNEARLKRWKILEQNIARLDQTQIFIETPYRNNKLIAEMIRVLSPSTKLCIASDITGENESIITHTIAEWRNIKYDYDKVPTIFLIYKLLWKRNR
ncbi:MAG: SAM-dependent methyltransferase, partial [Muribaculaceae bacterium]|nr:SAM-dependent methyltransferase [Muribaculaceae bacterium]